MLIIIIIKNGKIIICLFNCYCQELKQKSEPDKLLEEALSPGKRSELMSASGTDAKITANIDQLVKTCQLSMSWCLSLAQDETKIPKNDLH